MIAAIASVVTWFWGAYATYNKLPAVFHGICDFVAGMAVMWLWKTLAIIACGLALAGTASAISPQTADPCPVNGSGCACGCVSGQACNCTAPDPVAASVRVDVPYTDGSTHSGSGTVVALYDDAEGKASCVIVTNRHVCPCGSKVTVRWPGDAFTSDARWLGCDDQADLAALCAYAPPDAVACRPAKDGPATGEQLVQVGYPRTRGPVRRVGAALAFCGAYVRGCPVFLAQITTEQGDSGSGLFNRRGQLVAVCWGGKDGQCHAVNTCDVQRFLLRPATRKLFPELHDCVIPPRAAMQPVTYAPAFGGNCSGGS